MARKDSRGSSSLDNVYFTPMTATEFRNARHELGFTQAGFARAIGASHSSIVKREAGTHRIPKSTAILVRLMRESQRVLRRVKEITE